MMQSQPYFTKELQVMTEARCLAACTGQLLGEVSYIQIKMVDN